MLFARYHRERVSTQFQDVLVQQQRTPQDVNKVKEELAEKALTRETLQRELDGRLKFAQALKSENFYLSVDTQAKVLRFYYGDTVLREAPLTIGESKTIKAQDGRSWTFLPLKGAFHVESKLVDHDWRVAEWVYAMNGQPVPAERPVIEGGLGRYVLLLPNNYVIHSPPVEGSPLKGAKPGSFMVPEADLRAIWPRVSVNKMQVYVF